MYSGFRWQKWSWGVKDSRRIYKINNRCDSQHGVVFHFECGLCKYYVSEGHYTHRDNGKTSHGRWRWWSQMFNHSRLLLYSPPAPSGVSTNPKRSPPVKATCYSRQLLKRTSTLLDENIWKCAGDGTQWDFLHFLDSIMLRITTINLDVQDRTIIKGY